MVSLHFNVQAIELTLFEFEQKPRCHLEPACVLHAGVE